MGTNALYNITQGALPKSNDINQLVGASNGSVDIGTWQMAPPISAPSSALTATANTTSGNLNGSYVYGATFVTGTIDDAGQLHEAGETTISPLTSETVVSNGQVALSSIPTGPSTCVARRIYRAHVVPDPASALSLSTATNATSTLAATTYYLNIAWGNAQGTTTTGSSQSSIAVPTANADEIQFSVTLPSGATYVLIGMGTASGSEGQYAQVSSSGAVTYEGGNISGVSASVSGSTITITITKPPSSTSTPMPSSNTSVIGNPQLVTTILNNTQTTYQDNTADASLGVQVPTQNTTGTTWVYPNLSAFPPNPVVGMSALVNNELYFWDGTEWNQQAPANSMLVVYSMLY